MSSLRDFYWNVVVGKKLNRYNIESVPGVRQFLLRGLLLNANNTTPQVVWNYGGNYTYLLADTPLYISSSSASDTDVDIRVTGLNDQLEDLQTITTLNGQNQVLCGNFYRVHDVVAVRNPCLGEVWVAEADTLTAGEPDTPSKVKGKISNSTLTGETVPEFSSDNSSHIGLYTVPKGFNLFLNLVLGTSEGQEGQLTYLLRS